MTKVEQAVTPSIPFFDATRGSYRQLGLLPLTEMAARRAGDAVLLHLPAGQDVILLSGADGADHFARHVESRPAERGDVTSNGSAVHRLLGASRLANEWRLDRLSIDAHLPHWLGQARADATCALLHNALNPDGADPLRVLCKLWSVRACCPALLGQAIAESDLVEGLLHIEHFFTTLNGFGPQADTGEAEKAFKRARAFIDDTLSAALSGGASEDNAVSFLRPLLPSGYSTKEMIDELRPVIFGLLFESIQIDGLNLLWALIELARNEALATEIATQDQAGPLARATAMEVLRLYPELPFIRRTGSFPDVGNNKTENVVLLYAPWLIHRDARLWSEPARFQPQRFLPDAGTTGLPNIYMPFGLGPLARKRTEFVIAQLAATLTTICKTARLSLMPNCPAGHLRTVYHATLQPRGDIDVRWQHRPGFGRTGPTLWKGEE